MANFRHFVAKDSCYCRKQNLNLVFPAAADFRKGNNMEAVTESRKVWLEENSFHSPYNEQQIVESLAQMCFITLKEMIKIETNQNRS